MTDANQLLQDYARHGSDSAFRELVNRYVDLVYSVAVRRVGGDSHSAEDVTQTVFADLAKKAATLSDDVMLGGWLHRHTCFVSSTFVRSERRRQAREKEAAEMNQNNTDSTWEQLAPLVDDAIDQLDPGDREALVLRFYEKQNFRSVGAALGVSDDTAQKRVSRAVDRLRDIIARQGVTLTAAALATLLTAHAVFAAPVELAASASSAALGVAASGAVATGGLLQFLAAAKFKLAVIAAGVITAGLIVIPLVKQRAEQRPAAVETNAASVAALSEPSATPLITTNATIASIESTTTKRYPGENGLLQLTILSPDTGQPVPGIRIDYRRWDGEAFTGRTLRTRTNGTCDVTFRAEGTTDLELTTRMDGFADTKLHWLPKRGEQIPTNYVLKLTRPVPIGGTVVGPDGSPVAGAKVGWNDEAAPEEETGVESHEFGWIEVKTDQAGRWRINRIAPEMIRRIYGSARHTNYVDTTLLFANREPELEKQLLEEKHVFHLGRAVWIRGTVMDNDGKPVPGAKVLLGENHNSERRETKTRADGSFDLGGCKTGENLLSAEAVGFSTTTIEVNIAENSAPFELKLQRGKLLQLRVVSQDGTPIKGANVWLNTSDRQPIGMRSGAVPVQANFEPKTDEDGRVVWFNAPEGKMKFDIAATDYMRVNEFVAEADGEEHVITMPPALTVKGSVRDATTGELIPRFRILSGWPSRFGEQTNIYWSTLDRFWLTFSGGTFRHSYDEPLIYGMEKNPGYVLKFTADGYAPFTSRIIESTEGEVEMNVELKPAAATSVTVLQPDGTPAVRADVGLVSPGLDLHIGVGGLSRDQVQSAGSILVTDINGKFRLPPEDTIRRVIVCAEGGYGEATVEDLQKNLIVQLQPWARIEGVYLSGGRPVAGRELLLGYPQKSPGLPDVSFDFHAFKVTTDAEGKFVFPRVPWGKLQLIRLVVQNESNHRMSWTHVPFQEIQVQPGETKTLTIGSSSYTITARTRLPEGAVVDSKMQFHGMIGLPGPTMPAYTCTLDGDGVVRAEDIPPGRYQMNIGYFSIPQNRGAAPTGYQGRTQFVVPSDPPTGTLDLGEITLSKWEPK